MPRPDPGQLAAREDVDLAPVLERHPMDLLVSFSAVTHLADSPQLRRQVMTAIDFPSDDMQLFLVVNQLALRGAMRPTMLADAIQTGRSNMTKIAGRLAKEDLAVRIPDPDDDRGVLLALTPKGREIGRALVEYDNAQTARLVDGWSDDDLATFQRLLARFTASLGATLPPATADALGFPRPSDVLAEIAAAK
ncbi:MarR family winged helix-turn-helix transcriptional regulator [Paenarthrobacter sp. NPDC057981]|uniref:MarR family winged helix-turn-helix transcriptional regulator n=1 Tax=Paenarthrobacter sp. NPDC057981 TaxID=3346297 RepID=UPI0036DDE7A1